MYLYLVVGNRQEADARRGRSSSNSSAGNIHVCYTLRHAPTQSHAHTYTYGITYTHTHSARSLSLSQVSVRYIQAHFRMWMWRKKAGCQPATLARSLPHSLSLSRAATDALSCSLCLSLSLRVTRPLPAVLIITAGALSLSLFGVAYPWDTCFLLLLLPFRGLSPVSVFFFSFCFFFLPLFG